MGKENLSQNEKNDIVFEFMAKFGGLHTNNANEDAKADEIMRWTIDKIEQYRDISIGLDEMRHAINILTEQIENI